MVFTVWQSLASRFSLLRRLSCNHCSIEKPRESVSAFFLLTIKGQRNFSLETICEKELHKMMPFIIYIMDQKIRELAAVS